jgi:hypothetical protein
MAIITKFTTVEYGQNSELSQLSEGDCSRYDARKLPVVKDLNCVVYEMKRILGHSQNIDEAAFFGKYGRLLEIAKIGVLNPAIKALINFWDPDYRCFSFGNVDLCPTIEEYGMLMEFPKHLHQVYFPLRNDKVIPELSKLLKIPHLSRFLEKNGSGLKWKFLEVELEKKKEQCVSVLVRDRLIALGIYGLVLFPSLKGVISLEAAAAFVEYENTHVNPTTAILAETLLTLNHFRKTGKGAVRCCTQLLYIWMVSHVETKKPIFNNFWWFNQKPLKIVEEEEWGILGDQGWMKKLQELPNSNFSWKAPWVKSVDVIVSCGQKCWVPLIGITGYVSYAPALVVRQLGGIQHIPRTVGLAEFSGFFKDQSAREVLETIKQDWSQLTLIQKESESLRGPSSSEGYEKWRNLTPIAASKKPCSEDGPSRIKEGSLKRKKGSNEEDLIEQIERLQKELGKSKGDKAALEKMMMEGDKSRVFLNEQLKAKDAKIGMLELQLSKGKAVIEESEKERGRLILDLMQSSSELEALKADFDGYQENVEYNQDKFLHVKAELLDRIEKYDELNKKYMMIESRLAELQEFERKGNEEEVLKADLAAKKIEIRMLKVKFDKEREKVKQLTNRLEVSEKHKEQIDTNNNTLNRNNMLLIEKMAKVDEQMDEAAIHARIIRANARRVGRDIFRYRQSLAETDAFLEKIENRGLAFLPVARDMDEEED